MKQFILDTRKELKTIIANNKRHETKRYNELKKDFDLLRSQFIELKKEYRKEKNRTLFEKLFKNKTIWKK